MADRDDLEFTYSLIDRIFRLSLGELADFSGASTTATSRWASRRPSAASTSTWPTRSASHPGGRSLTSVAGGARCSTSPGAEEPAGWASPCPPRRRLPAAPTGSTSTSRTRAASRPKPSAGSTSGQPRRLRALLLSRGARGRAAGRRLPRALHPAREPPADRRPAVPPDDGVRTQHDPGGSNRHHGSAGFRRLELGLDGAPPAPLPYGKEQIVRTADPHFRLVSSTSGRLDYIETIRQWRMRSPRRASAGRR
jgi:cyclopropane-fatty-acyl-phospholipid synthase